MAVSLLAQLRTWQARSRLCPRIHLGCMLGTSHLSSGSIYKLSHVLRCCWSCRATHLEQLDQAQMLGIRTAWFEEVGGPPIGNKCAIPESSLVALEHCVSTSDHVASNRRSGGAAYAVSTAVS